MPRKSLAILAVGLMLAAPSSALAMHGPREQPPRVPGNVESGGSSAQAPFVIEVSADRSFSWSDAGVGASVTAACVLLLAAGRRVRLHHAS
jgi:hypothetical protein